MNSPTMAERRERQIFFLNHEKSKVLENWPLYEGLVLEFVQDGLTGSARDICLDL